MKLVGPGEDITPADIVEGVLLWFEAGKRWYVRPPKSEEYDEARHIERTALKLAQARPEVKQLAAIPISGVERARYELSIAHWKKTFDEQEDGTTLKEQAADMLAWLQTAMESRTEADVEAEAVATLKRDRFLLFLLLCDENGRATFKPSDPEAEREWDALPVPVKNAGRGTIRKVLEALETLPFGSDLPQDSASS